MRKTSHFSGRSLAAGCAVVTILFFFSLIPETSADFADRRLRLYLSLGWQPTTSVPIGDEMSKASYGQITEPGSPPIGSAALLYSANPRLSIGLEGWWTHPPAFRGHKTLPLTFYAYLEGGMDTVTHVMEIQGIEYFHVGMIGPTVQWTLTSRESRQLYIRGMLGIASYSSGIERFASWSSGGHPTYSVLALDCDRRHEGAYGAGLTLGGHFHASWISFGLEAAVRYSSPKTLEASPKRADTITAGGFLVKPEEGGITMPAEKRKLSFRGISLGIVVGIHAF